MLGEEKGDVDGGLSYRLRLRCAHLIGKDAKERRRVSEHVRDIYSVRSGIVHRGITDVAESDVEEAQALVRRSLHAMLEREDLFSLKNGDAVRAWFEARILG